MGLHEYIRCPLCGWWHVLHYRLKPGRKRSQAEYRYFDFDIDLSQNASVYQHRTLIGAGRGSPGATISIDLDVKGLDNPDVPDELKQNILRQSKLIVAILEGQPPPAVGPVVTVPTPPSLISPPAVPKKPKVPKPAVPAKPKKAAVARPPKPAKAPPVKPAAKVKVTAAPLLPMAEWRSLPIRDTYSAKVAALLPQHLTNLIKTNQERTMHYLEKGVPTTTDIMNRVVFEEFERLSGMLADWYIDYEEGVKAGKGQQDILQALRRVDLAARAYNLADTLAAANYLAALVPVKPIAKEKLEALRGQAAVNLVKAEATLKRLGEESRGKLTPKELEDKEEQINGAKKRIAELAADILAYDAQINA